MTLHSNSHSANRLVSARVCLAAFAIVVSPIVLSGCGSGERRYQLSGTVTFKGKPVPGGYIVFEPDSSKGNMGGPGRAEILDGKYDTSDQDEGGVLGGPHVIRITGFDKRTSGMTGSEITLPKSLFENYTITEDLPKKNGKMDFEVKTK